MATRRVRGFSWIPQVYNTDWKVLIGTTDVTDDVLSLRWERALAPEIPLFIFKLDNNSNKYNSSFKGGETLEIRYDFGQAASTTRFKGIVEEVSDVFNRGSSQTITLRGTHLSGVLANKTVTRSYTSAKADDIIKDLFSTYFSSFTTNNVTSSNTDITISWEGVNFWEACSEIASIAGYVLYVDDDLDVHFFLKNSKTSSTEAIVYEDNLLRITGLGTDTADVRNTIRISSENEGLPVIYTASDSGSKSDLEQSFFDGTKELYVNSSQIKSFSDAKIAADSELANKKDKLEYGTADSLMLITLNPGEKIWISDPDQGILDEYLAYKITHHLPAEETKCSIETVKDLYTLFRSRDVKFVKNRAILNSNNLNFSYNFGFDNDNLTDTTASSSNVATADSQLYLSSGSAGVWISDNRTVDTEITKVEVKALGEVLQDATFYVQTDGSSWQQVNLNELTTISNGGKLLRLKIDLNSANVRVSGAVILYT